MSIRETIEEDFPEGAEFIIYGPNQAAMHIIRTQEGVRECSDSDTTFDGWNWIQWSVVEDFRVLRAAAGEPTPFEVFKRAVEDFTEAINPSGRYVTSWVLVYQDASYRNDPDHNTEYPMRFETKSVVSETMTPELAYGLLSFEAKRLYKHI